MRTRFRTFLILPVLLPLLALASLMCSGKKSPKEAPAQQSSPQKQESESSRELCTSVIIDTHSSSLRAYWKDQAGNTFGSIAALKEYAEGQGKKLRFAMNAGMFDKNFAPIGLFIQDAKLLHSINRTGGDGNFFLKPNGVFFLSSKNKAVVCTTEEFPQRVQGIRLATQSGPMLLIHGQIHPAFQKDSKNLNIRNGVGILANGNVLFAISNREVNFYDFAMYFKKCGCRNALYLDGVVSRLYAPEKNYL